MRLHGMCWEDTVLLIFLYNYICQYPDSFVSSCIADCCLYVLLSMKLVGPLFSVLDVTDQEIFVKYRSQFS